MASDGTLDVPTGGDSQVSFGSTALINNAALHRVVVARGAFATTLTIDAPPTGNTTGGTMLNALPPLAIVMGDPCEAPEGQLALAGLVTAICLQTF